MPDWLLLGPERIEGYLWTAALLFAIGVFACAARRNAVGFLMGIELMLNAAALQFAAYGRFRGDGSSPDGQMAALFIILLAAAEATVALALIFSFFRTSGDVDLDRADTLGSR